MTASPPTRGAAAWVVAAASFGFAIVQLDVTIVNVALPAIGRALGGGVAQLQWTVDAYALLFAVLLPSAGVIGDRIGARGAYLAGFGLFALASAGCGLAPSAGVLIAARAAQGLGAALLVPPSLALLNHATAHDAKARARAVGIWTAAGGVSIALGPVIGGALVEAFGWPSIFLVNLPVCAAGALATWLKVPAPPRSDAHGLDLGGQGLAILALASLVGAVIEARPLGLGSPWVWAGFAVSAAAGAGFWLTERRVNQPMLPPRFLRLPGFKAAIAFGIAVNLAYYGVLFVLSLYLQRVLGYSAMQAGLAYLPLTATFIVSNLASGWMVGRWGSRLPMAAGALVAALGYALLVRLGPASGPWDLLAPFLMIPAGMGLGVPAMTTAILASVDRASAGVASAVLNTARQAAGAVGVAAFGALAAGEGGIVWGLRAAALISAAMLIAAGATARFGLPAQRRDAAPEVAAQG